jgi:hypothetical protein
MGAGVSHLPSFAASIGWPYATCGNRVTSMKNAIAILSIIAPFDI